MSNLKCVDIVLVKQQVDSGKLATKIDRFGNILLEDTIAGEAVKIGKLPDGYSFRAKSSWNYDGTCRNCGKHVLANYTAYCPSCGADMKAE